LCKEVLNSPRGGYYLLKRTTEERDSLRERLRRLWGVAVSGGSDDRHIEIFARPPQTEHEAILFVNVLTFHELYDAACEKADRAGQEATAKGVDADMAVALALIAVFQSFPIMILPRMIWLGDSDRNQGQEALSLAGWLYTMTRAYPRLAQALSMDGGSFGEALQARLPGSAFEAFKEWEPSIVAGEWQPHHTLKSLRQHVIKGLASEEADPDITRRAPIDPLTILTGIPDKAGDDLQLREEAAARVKLNSYFTRARLSTRERQAAELRSGGYLLREIAQEMGVSLGAVKKVLARADSKLGKLRRSSS
jgi:DNA-directed RNA polymerase specialized sigma24 family protein